MKCFTCGGNNMRPQVGPYRIDMGLDDKITLINIEYRHCHDCGEEAPGIPRMAELFAVVATTLAQKPARLTPKEVTFLRRELMLSNEQFAAVMGVSIEQARRWQRQKGTPIPVAEERLLRMLALGHINIDEILTTAIKDACPLRSVVTTQNDHWTSTELQVGM